MDRSMIKEMQTKEKKSSIKDVLVCGGVIKHHLPLFKLLREFNFLLNRLQQLTIDVHQFDAYFGQFNFDHILACYRLVAHPPGALHNFVLLLATGQRVHVPLESFILLLGHLELRLLDGQLGGQLDQLPGVAVQLILGRLTLFDSGLVVGTLAAELVTIGALKGENT